MREQGGVGVLQRALPRPGMGTRGPQGRLRR